MKIIEPSYGIIYPTSPELMMEHIEWSGRKCYKSEDRITEGSAEKFVKFLVDRGHEAVLEHCSFTVHFIVDRGISHELVRHRLASYCQESTRYCNYSKDGFGNEITVVRPCYLEEGTYNLKLWESACKSAEAAYFALLDYGCTPQEARAVLPNSLKTEVVMTANLREWRHFLKLRTAKAAHPQMRQVTIPLLRDLQKELPAVFGDITVE